MDGRSSHRGASRNACDDFWRREGDKLAENWVFIDKIDLLQQMGVDIFKRLRNDQQYF